MALLTGFLKENRVKVKIAALIVLLNIFVRVDNPVISSKVFFTLKRWIVDNGLSTTVISCAILLP